MTRISCHPSSTMSGSVIRWIRHHDSNSLGIVPSAQTFRRSVHASNAHRAAGMISGGV